MSGWDVRTELKDLRERTGLSVRDVAEKIDRPWTTYHYYETKTKKKYLPIELAEKLAVLFAKYGVDRGEVFALAGVDDANRTLVKSLGFRENDLVEYRPPPEQETYVANVVHALYPGRHPAANVWQIRGPALELAGYLDDDLVIVDLNRIEARAGDVVCAQIYDAQRATAHTIIRIYEPPYLIAMSNDPAYRKPELVDEDRVVIKGLIVASFRRPI